MGEMQEGGLNSNSLPEENNKFNETILSSVTEYKNMLMMSNLYVKIKVFFSAALRRLVETNNPFITSFV